MASRDASPSAGAMVDDAIKEALISVVGPGRSRRRRRRGRSQPPRDQVREALGRDLKQRATRRSRLPAVRRCRPCQPAGAGELEARWNKALAHVAAVEAKIVAHDAVTIPLPKIMTGLPRSPPRHTGQRSQGRRRSTAPTTDARLKKRIVRTVIREIIADIDDKAAEIVLMIHWMGGVQQYQPNQ